MLMQSVFEQWANDIKTAVEAADPIEVWAWILIITGVFTVFLLIFFPEFQRAERESVKFSAISAVIAAVLLGFGFHLLLMSYNLW